MDTEAIAAFDLLSRMRFACGDNGKRMQDELEEYLRGLKRDAERYRWLRNYYGSVDFEPADHDGMDLVFSVPQGEVSADCDKTIDGLMQGANT